ncbi:MAG: hypothetical protein QOD81_1135 [Solirubrobacteraceae bacterium]|jgi:hypothetical protein|nr:hypothetical protein [Solirubrobacteraceae bacterium]
MLSPRRTLAAALAAAAVLPTAPALAAPVEVPAALGPRLDRADARTPLAILLPDMIDLDFDGRVYASSAAGARSWSFALAGAPGCGGATACFLASFSAERGATPAYRTRVRLRGGIPGWFKPLTCGASCSPPAVQYRRRGVLYEIAAKVPDATAAAQRRRLVRAADEALRIGPR